MSSRTKQDARQRQYKDRTIPTRLERQLKNSEDEETIRFALANGGSAVLEREKNNVEATRR